MLRALRPWAMAVLLLPAITILRAEAWAEPPVEEAPAAEAPAEEAPVEEVQEETSPADEGAAATEGAAPEVVAESAVATEDPRELMRLAVTAYREGKAKEAAQLFVRAYKLTKHHIPLKGAAQAFLDAEMYEEALPWWKLYRAQPQVSDEDRGNADSQIRFLREQVAQIQWRKQEAAAEAKRQEGERRRQQELLEREERLRAELQSQAVLDSDQGMSTLEWTGIGLMGGGGAVLLGSVAPFILSAQKDSELADKQSMRDDEGRVIGLSFEEAEELQGQVSLNRNLGIGLAGVGGAALITGVVLYILDSDVDVGFMATPNAAMASVGGSF